METAIRANDDAGKIYTKQGKVTHEIQTLEDLIKALHVVFESDSVNVEYVKELMLSYKSKESEWKKYAKFDRYRYTRNLVDIGNGKFNLIVLCWGEGHASPIHDHADAHCFMKMLKGELEEVRYAWPEAHDPNTMKKIPEELCYCSAGTKCPTKCGADAKCSEDQRMQCDEPNFDDIDMQELGRYRVSQDDVCYINDSLGLHRVENPSNSNPAVSLHLYCPPFDSCHIFNQKTGQKTKVPVTFWSKYGEKRDKEILDVRQPEDK